MADHRSGFVALVGRPNVGKSTLLNQLVGQKISIVTPRPQTTRHRVVGVRTAPEGQIAFIDTPGIHGVGKHAMDRYMDRSATGSLGDADVVVVVVEALKLNDDDIAVIERATSRAGRVGLVVNKVDKVADKMRLLPFMQEVEALADFEFVIPLSATTGENCGALVAELLARLPVGPALYPDDQVTDRSMRFLAAEAVREKLMLRLHHEVPYGLTVEIERYEETGERVNIGAVIWVGRDAHKGIVIGKGGAMLKDVGTAARRDIERSLGQPVFLQLFVKVREGWTDDEQALHRFGYD